MTYDNMPFRNKQAAKSDRTGMSAGPGDPPKKGTATTKTKLETAMEIYESKSAKLGAMKGSEGRDALRSEVRSMGERIKAMPGGVEALQSKTGRIGVGSQSGKGVTTKDISKMTGESEEKVKKNIQGQSGRISGERVRRGMK